MDQAAGTNSRKPGANSWAEAEALVADLQIELPTAEQWDRFVRKLVLGSPNPVPDDASIRLRAWWEGLAVLELIEAQPGLRRLGLADSLRRVLAALEEQLAGRQPALLTVKRGEGYRWLPKSPAMARLMAYVAHFAVAMMAGRRRVGAFGADEAAEVVARHLNDAGFDWRNEGRVGMWRGGVRSGISVAAPFVWRCLNGLTIAPFPHPPHRTWRANFPHHALGQDVTLSSTTRRAQAGSGARA